MQAGALFYMYGASAGSTCSLWRPLNYARYMEQTHLDATSIAVHLDT